MAQRTSSIRTDAAVAVHFEARLADGSLIDSTRGGPPLGLRLGFGEAPEAIEAALLRMQPGDWTEVTLAPEQAFGARDESRTLRLLRSLLPEELELREGKRLYMPYFDRGDGLGWVRRLDPASALLDFNHPLAGQPVHYELELAARDPEGDECLDVMEVCAADGDPGWSLVAPAGYSPDWLQRHRELFDLQGLQGTGEADRAPVG